MHAIMKSWEDKTAAQQFEGVDAKRDMTDGGQDCDTGSEAPRTQIMKYSQNGRTGKIRARSGWINCRPEKLGIDQQ